MTREPVFSGSWYPGRPAEMAKALDGYMAGAPSAKQKAIGIVSPHAGWIYSGPVAGAVYGCVDLPGTAVVMCPNHTGLGSPRSIWPAGEWKIPGQAIEVDEGLAGLVARHAGLEADPMAHVREHSLEIQLPFVARRRPDVKIVPICLSYLRFPEIEEIGKGVARAIRESGRDAILIASTDMSHHMPAGEAEKLDRMAIERMEAFDAKGLFEVVRRNGITMCGVVPTTAVLVAAKELGASGVKLVKYANSGHVTGDMSEVVAYAALAIS